MRPRAWDEGIATGISTIDAEHRLQVTLVNALEQVLRQGTDRALADRTVAQLVDFTSVHFRSEELMMRLYAYPQLDAHGQEHARLLEQVAEIRRRVEQASFPEALAQVDALRVWLTAHMKSMDLGFALWCGRRGIRPDPDPGAEPQG
jgi:hemerythrin-like metal-binding protein